MNFKYLKMIQLAICGESLAWFGIAFLTATAIATLVWTKTNNEYLIMKNQTRGADYQNKVFKLWLPFAALVVVLLLMCALPFLLIDAPKYF